MPVAYKDYYKTLGVSKNASAEDIKRAYRKLARQHHPDVSKNKDAAQRFKEINEANEVLADPEKRKRYDSLGPDWERYAQSGGPSGGGAPGGFRYVHTSPGSAGFGDGDTDFSDFFRTIFSDLGGAQEGFRTGPFQTGRGRARPLAGADAEHEIEISLPEAFTGTNRSLRIERETGGTRTLEVKIPAGVRDGQRIRLAGQGGAGAGGGRSGDLYLKVKVRPHPFFTRDGDDIGADLPVSLSEALLGAEVMVPTLKSRVSLRIPPETQNGRTIRLAGQGMPRASGGLGDMYVTVKVVLPTKLSEKEREAIREIAASRADENVRGHLL